MEVVVNREGEQNGVCPLYFDGMTNSFLELPKPDDPTIEKFYNTIKMLNVLIKVPKKKNIHILEKTKEFFKKISNVTHRTN